MLSFILKFILSFYHSVIAYNTFCSFVVQFIFSFFILFFHFEIYYFILSFYCLIFQIILSFWNLFLHFEIYSFILKSFLSFHHYILSFCNLFFHFDIYSFILFLNNKIFMIFQYFYFNLSFSNAVIDYLMLSHAVFFSFILKLINNE